MKFGQYLIQHQFQPWQNEYLNYNNLKHFLKERQQSFMGWTQQNEVYFSENLIVTELDKVNGFIYLKIKQVGIDAQKIQGLIDYINLNDVGFYKILKKHDKWTGIDLLTSIRFQGIHQQFQSFITQLSQLNTTSSNKVQEELGRTTTTKYWVHLDNLTEVQAILLFHLPATSTNIINAVYFDHPTSFTLYSEFLERHEQAEIIRARWYNDAEDVVYFEKKLHYESWTNNKGSYSKERFGLYNTQVNQYLNSGHYNNNNTQSKSIFSALQRNQAKPTLRAYHHRTTYNHAENDLFHISLDTKVTFIKEQQGGSIWKSKHEMNYPAFQNLHRDEICFFPYAILEIKTIRHDATVVPDWITHMVETSQLVYEVPYFSKYLHGTCHFYRDRLPLLPWWLGEMNIDIRKKSSYATIQSKNSSSLGGDHTMTARGGGQCIVIEPPLTPDYVNVSRSPTPRVMMDEEKRIYSNTASSCTIIDEQQLHSRIGLTLTDKAVPQHRDDGDALKPSAYDMFMNSKVVTKMRDIKDEYMDDSQNRSAAAQQETNHVGMMTWLWARITNNQAILSSPQYNATAASASLSPEENEQVMPKKGKLNKKKIEPKIFFANERTFISWLQFSALLLSVSLGLINFGDHLSRASGGFFIVIAMILAGYAQLRFQYRAWQIRYRGDSRFDDMYGPAVLCIVLVIALIVNLGLRMNQPLPEHPNLFGHHTSSNGTATANNGTTLIIKNHQLPNGTKIDRPNGRIIQFDDGRIIVFPNNDDLDD